MSTPDMLQNLHCNSARDALSALEGIGTGLIALSGAHDFWKIDGSTAKKLENSQRKLQELQTQWNAKLTQAQGEISQREETYVQEQIKILNSTENLTTLKLTGEIQTNRLFIFGLIVTTFVIVYYLLTLA